MISSGRKRLLNFMKWEYLVFNFPLTMKSFRLPTVNAEALASQLNQLGSEGWELVSVTHSTSSSLTATLKRLITSNQ